MVPCVRPSHGSLQYAANGSPPSSLIRSAAAWTSKPTSQCPVWNPNAVGLPSGCRTPPCVLRIRYCGSSRSSGAHPMAASWVSPNRLPLGQARSIASESGSEPSGPVAAVCTSNSASSSQLSNASRAWPGELWSFMQSYPQSREFSLASMAYTIRCVWRHATRSPLKFDNNIRHNPNNWNAPFDSHQVRTTVDYLSG